MNNIPTLKELITKVLESSNAKFDESIDICVSLGIDPKKSEQNVKSTCVMPHMDKNLQIAVLTNAPAQQELASAAGAIAAGMAEVLELIAKREIKPHLVLATPEAMGKLPKAGQVLGPKNLMPSVKLNTITDNLSEALTNARRQVWYKSDKYGIVRASIGRKSQSAEHIVDNVICILESIKAAKPRDSKGKYIKSVQLSLTMGPAFTLPEGILQI